jgi:hypothetical protein
MVLFIVLIVAGEDLIKKAGSAGWYFLQESINRTLTNNKKNNFIQYLIPATR